MSPAEQSLTRLDVIQAFQYILGREPESEDTIQYCLGLGDKSALRDALFHSEEFQLSHLLNRRFTSQELLDKAGPNVIETSATPVVMEKLMRRVERSWTNLGESRPQWSVATEPAYLPENFEQNREQYQQSGYKASRRLFWWLERNRLDAARLPVCLEFGCGTGRVTRWLAESFASVVACDISPPHLALAREAVAGAGFSNVAFVHTGSRAALEGLPKVDLVYSQIVLQHNPPPVIAALLRCLLGLLKPGGAAFFQVPTYGVAYRFVVEEYLATPETGDIEMHAIPQSEVFRIADEAGCRALEVQPDDLTASTVWNSNTFLLRKREAE